MRQRERHRNKWRSRGKGGEERRISDGARTSPRSSVSHLFPTPTPTSKIANPKGYLTETETGRQTDRLLPSQKKPQITQGKELSGINEV